MVVDAKVVDDDVLERVGVENDDLFPKSRLGSLDADVLRELGLTSSTVKTNDFLFTLQLILPICDPQRSVINIHAMSLVIVIAYDMYFEVMEGKLGNGWKIVYPVDFWTFCDVLSIQTHYVC